jgi:hypothetical protein
LVFGLMADSHLDSQTLFSMILPCRHPVQRIL